MLQHRKLEGELDGIKGGKYAKYVVRWKVFFKFMNCSIDSSVLIEFLCFLKTLNYAILCIKINITYEKKGGNSSIIRNIQT